METGTMLGVSVAVAVAVAFASGLALGYISGVFSYYLTYQAFQDSNEVRTRKRVALASQQAAIAAREQANKLHRLRSLHGPTLSETPVADSQMEDILGTGPNGGRE